MIHPGDILLKTDTQLTYVVVRVGTHDIQVVRRNDPPEYLYPEINESTLEIIDSTMWQLDSCQHNIRERIDALNGTNHSAFYAGQVGALEYRIVTVYESIVSALYYNDGAHTSSVAHQLNWAKSCIESTAERLAGIQTPAFATPASYVRDMIYKNRK